MGALALVVCGGCGLTLDAFASEDAGVRTDSGTVDAAIDAAAIVDAGPDARPAVDAGPDPADCGPWLERCGNATDDDCDGEVDEHCPCDPTPVRIGMDVLEAEAPHMVGTDGGFAIVWIDVASVLNGRHVHAIEVDDDGAPTSAEVDVSLPVDGMAFEPEIAWTGDGFAVVYAVEEVGQRRIRLDTRAADWSALRRYDANMSFGGVGGSFPSIEWTGSDFALVWAQTLSGQSFLTTALLAPDFGSTSVNLMSGGVPDVAAPSLAWDGSSLATAFEASRPRGGMGVFFQRLSGTGMDGPQRPTSAPDRLSVQPSIAEAARGWAVAWSDSRLTESGSEIFHARVRADVVTGGPWRFTNAAGHSTQPSVAWVERAPAIAWTDNRDGPSEIRFAGLFRGSSRFEVVVSVDPVPATAPALAYNGRVLAAVWEHDQEGAAELRFARICLTP